MKGCLKSYLCFVFSFLIFINLKPVEIFSGIDYEHLYEDPPMPLSVHILEVDPSKISVVLKMANDKCLGAEKVSSMAQRENAVAAINGNFFNFGDAGKIKSFFLKLLGSLGFCFYDAIPSFNAKANEKWFTSTKRAWGAFGWSDYDNDFMFGNMGKELKIKINNKIYLVDTTNQFRNSSQAVIYTSEFGDKTKTDGDGIDFVIIHNSGLGSRIVAIEKNKKQVCIPERGYVFSVGSRSGIDISDIAMLMDAELNYEYFDDYHDPIVWKHYQHIIGSYPILIFNGEITSDVTQRPKNNTFTYNRHPRSAVGLLDNGNLIFVVVDGHQKKFSVGMTLPELALLLKAKGCKYALNLDGGSSSTLVLNNKVVNSPAVNIAGFGFRSAERAVANAILMIPKKLPN